MNIVVIPSPRYEEMGGVSTHVYMLSDGLTKKGHNITVINSNISTLYERIFIRIPTYVIGKISKISSIKYDIFAKNIYYIIKTLLTVGKNIDIINVQGTIYMYTALILRQLIKCKIVLTVHGYMTYEKESSGECSNGDILYNWLWELETSSYKKADSVVAVGSKLSNYLKKHTNVPVYKIFNGIDPNKFYPANNKKDKEIVLLFSGALEQHKGIMDSIYIAEILIKQGINIKLYISGIGNQEESAKDYVLSNGLTGRIIFLGKLNKNDMPGFYNGGDILLCPYKQRSSGNGEETFGYTALEAMACGVTVMAYRTGGLCDQVIEGITGFMVDQNDISSMVDLIKMVIEDNILLMNLKQNSRKHAIKNYSNDIMADEFNKIFIELTR